MFDTALVMTNAYSLNSKLKKQNNKEVKTNTWCKKPPPNAIKDKEYFTPSLLELVIRGDIVLN